jgi:hypothetical protein
VPGMLPDEGMSRTRGMPRPSAGILPVAGMFAVQVGVPPGGVSYPAGNMAEGMRVGNTDTGILDLVQHDTRWAGEPGLEGERRASKDCYRR